jgi:endonuclease/exonuclease/phosphatase family metal-dependent hydrolase
MKRLLILLLCQWWSLVAFAETPFRVMVLNAEWFWTPHDGRSDGTLKPPRDPSAEAYRAELVFYRELIRAHAIDLVALVEIEHGGVARDLAGQLGAGWQSAFVQGRDTATGQDVAIISRLPFDSTTVSALDFPEGRLPGDRRGKRLSKFLTLTVQQGQRSLVVLTAHLLSRRDDSPDRSLNRQRQAQALLNASRQVSPGQYPVLMLGDFNSPAGTREFEMLRSGGGFKVAEQECEKKEAYKRSSVDQIFYLGLSCAHYTRIDLGTFSDHQAVLAEFRW